jgi:hypothetical protein
MSSAFDWNQFQSLGKPSAKKEEDASFDWNQYESLPQYDASTANQEQEGMFMAAARNLLQIPKGLANLTPVGVTLNALGALGTGEALSGLDDEFSEENIARLRQMFPSAPWENFDKQYGNYEGFRQKYLEGTQQAAQSFPTVENISRGIESATGIPLESKNLGHELIQLGTGLGTGLLNKLTTTPSKFSNVANRVKAQGVSERSLGPALQQQLGKKFSQGEIIAEGRRIGMTDAEIAPLLNSERRTRFLSKFSHKGPRPQKVLSQTYDKIGSAYESLKNSELAAKAFSSPLQRETLSSLQQTLKELPDVARQGILKDTELLLKEPSLNARNLINYRQKVQQTINANPDQYKTLSQLKKVVDQAILKSNPQLAKEYHGINRLFEKYADISKALKPSIVDKFVSKGEAVAGLGAVLTFNYPFLATVVGENAARRLATELLINPRFQQLSTKMVSALNQNKLGVAAKIAESMSKDIRPYSEELADELEEIDWESF